VLINAQVFASVEAAIADLAVVIATTDRNRYLNKPFADLPAAAVQMHGHLLAGTRARHPVCARADGAGKRRHRPRQPDGQHPQRSRLLLLNLAQAVLVVAWQLRLNSLSDPAGAAASIRSTSPPRP
jgi:tRNA C32,U32 (ribose-2'-O)-methylase TrmJ